MIVKYNQEFDVMYIRFTDTNISESKEYQPGIYIDYDDAGNIIGIEIPEASKKTRQPNRIIYEFA